MKRVKCFFWSFVICLVMSVQGDTAGTGMKAPNPDLGGSRTSAVPLSQVKVEGGFWGQKQELVRKTTMRAEWEQLESHHHVDNFRVVAGVKDGIHRGAVFLDSDLYKWLEAASYYMGKHPEDRWLRERVNEVISLINKAQMKDGYLNTYYQSFAPDKRFTNLWMDHELYCAGHLMEAAAAHANATGKNDLLNPARKFADLVSNTFGPAGKKGMPGHQEIELALMRMYRLTGDYKNTADFFVYERGKSDDFKKELLKDLLAQTRLAGEVKRKRKEYLGSDYEKQGSYGGIPYIKPVLLGRILENFYSGKYFQAHKPVLQQTVAEGHAVRAMYFYAGAAELYLANDDRRLLNALARIHDNTTQKRTYITGGMGALPVIEGFGKDYELPHKSYSETCAAIGSIFFSWRMLQATGEAKYADLIERTLYNGFLAALSLDGKRFFYENPLVARGETERRPWYPVACCPPNIARLMASLGNYVYSEDGSGLWLHQYVSGEVSFGDKGASRLEVESGLPYRGKIKISLLPEEPARFTLYLRQPSWISHLKVSVNGNPIEYEPEPGNYLDLSRKWKKGDTIKLDMGMGPHLVHGDPRVKANRGRAAIMYGPLVYCLEDTDNPGLNVHETVLARKPRLRAEYKPELLGGVVAVKGKTENGKTFTAIPYYAWANRDKSHMEVWLRAK
ncbi:MAG: glycoside hydrolase family 127 protein [bacterium]